MKHVLIIFFLLLSVKPAFAQISDEYIIPDFVPATPSAAALAKAITYPVSPNTGLVDIKIPLYELQVGDITLPIYLTYHGSGIKVQEPLNWVGAGWTLVAEPQISRIVEGYPDEERIDIIPPYQLNGCDLFYWLNGDVAIEKNPDRFFYRLTDKSGGFFFKSANSSPIVHPYEPIQISVGSNKFSSFSIIDENGLEYNFGGIAFIDEKPAYLEYTLDKRFASITNCWKARSIISKKTNASIGFQYDPYDVEYIYPRDYFLVSQQPELYPDWSSYIAGVYDSYTGKKYFVKEDGSKVPASSYTHSGNDDCSLFLKDFPGYYNGHGWEIAQDRVFGSKSGQCKLNTIFAGDCEVNFYTRKINDCYYNGCYLLDKIQVVKYNRHNNITLDYEILKEIKFSLSQLGQSPAGGDAGIYTGIVKYKLDSLEISTGNNNPTVEKYRFSYYNPDGFPAINTRSIDYWGYYNGKANDDVSLVPTQGVASKLQRYYPNIPNILIDGSNRRSEDVGEYYPYKSTERGTLKEIIYPTGGKTTFKYEPHKFKQRVYNFYDEVVAGGGLRIKEIRETTGEPNSPEIIKRFEYSDGICKFPPVRYHDLDKNDLPSFFRTEKRIASTVMDMNDSDSYSITTLYCSSLMDLNTANGSPVVYNKVTEYIGDGLKTEYYYGYSTAFENTPVINFMLNPSTDYLEGKTESIIEYKKDITGIYRIAKKTGYEYANYNQKIITGYINNHKYEYQDYGNHPYFHLADVCLFSFPWDAYSPNPIISGCYLLTKQTETFYDENQKPVSTVVVYDYNDTGQSGNKTIAKSPTVVDTEVTRKWEGTGPDKEFFISDIMREHFYYPKNITLTGAPEQARTKLIELGAIGTLLKKNVSRGTGNYYYSDATEELVDNFTDSIVSSTLYDYNIFANNPFPMLSSVSVGKTENTRVGRVEFLEYNKYGKPGVIRKKGENDVVLLWGYKGEHLIAEIKNATYSQVVNALGGQSIVNVMCDEMQFVSNWSDGLRLQPTLSQSMITTYQYNLRGNLTSIIDPNGVTTYYDYDLFDRLKNVYILESGSKKIIEHYDYRYRN